MKKITQSLMAMSLVIPSAALIQSTTQVEAQTQKEVTSPSLNVRTGPGTNYKIVDWLQFFIHRRESRPVFKISVIISAWDLVMGSDQSPAEWLSFRLPFLNQFIKANSDLIPHSIYGVSAQGGKYPDDTESLLGKMRHSERIIVVGDDYEGNDITMPVKWLMS